MIHYTQGNLLDAEVDALVNTVNTVGVMGKGIALMFKERFPKNMAIYAQACKAKQVQTGKMFVTSTDELTGPQWVINFPTKQHWRSPSKMEWIVEGLKDLRSFIIENNVRSIAIPPLGAGNGKLNWDEVKPHIEQILADLDHVDVYVYEPTSQYQNVAKRKGELKLTPARAMIAELVRQYWTLGVECSLLEVQKLAWFLERSIERHPELTNNPLDLRFEANIYGPYADRLRHVLDHLDGTYLKCEKRISDSDPLDVIWFDDAQKERLEAYLKSSEMKPYKAALTETIKLIDGFETPFGLELLSTLDWLVHKEEVEPNKAALMDGISKWPAGVGAATRKSKIFHEKAVAIALNRLKPFYQFELA
ncbi:macro domain-containing protein [Rhodanobacter aciditrophus]|uniref:Macro domain-containing protein n=1 Tax=Rhodanobacter aciditrophus TaxID=1623218 RepID=A0ABW4B2P9_9GAMM